MTNERMTHVMELIKECGLDALVLNPGSSLSYLTGLDFHLMERPVLLFLISGENPAIICPELEQQKLKQVPFLLHSFTYGDNPATWIHAIEQVSKLLKLEGKRIGVEPASFRFLELDLLDKSIPSAIFVSADPVITNLRLRKSADEINAIQKAVDIAQEALLYTLPTIHSGITEKEISNQLVINLLECGSQPNLPFMPIVSAGMHSADPHAIPTDTILKPGDMLVIDWGARYAGYIADLTRTFALESMDKEFENIGRSVVKANQVGCATVKPGIVSGEIDNLTRNIINDDGYAQYFSHRTGHGIGLDPHEPPYIYSENQLVLEPGMTFTIEPGVYLPGIGGVRIEDNVVVTHTGVHVFSSMSRDIQVIK